MYHDFELKHGGWNGACNKQRGVMSYSMNSNYKHPWSTCSKNDFQKHYNNILNMKMSWCLEGKKRFKFSHRPSTLCKVGNLVHLGGQIIGAG